MMQGLHHSSPIGKQTVYLFDKALSQNFDGMNVQLRHWLDTVASPRKHSTTQRIVNEAFADERQHLRPLPLAPCKSVLKLERRVSREGMVSVGGNTYSVPDAMRSRMVEVYSLADDLPGGGFIQLPVWDAGTRMGDTVRNIMKFTSFVAKPHSVILVRVGSRAGKGERAIRGAGSMVERYATLGFRYH